VVDGVISEMSTWDGFLVSVLQVLRGGETVQARDLQDLVADHAGLTEAQRAEVIDSGSPDSEIASGGPFRPSPVPAQ
jgi:restriction endonuclease Mrr